MATNGDHLGRSSRRTAGAPVGADEPARLDALRRYGVLDTDPEQAFDDLVEMASVVCGTSMAAISLVDEQRQWFKAARNIPVRETPREWAFCSYTILSTTVLEVRDAHADPRFAENPLVTGEPWVRFYAAAPIRTHDGLALGSVCVLDDAPGSLSDSQRRALSTIARQAMVELEMRQALADRRTAEERLGALVRHASDVVAIVGADGSILYTSPGVEEMTGYGPEELFGVNSFTFVHAADLETAVDTFQRAAAAPGEPQRARVRFHTRDGAWKHLDVRTTNLLHDPAVNGVIVNVADVTEAVQMTAAVEESEQRFRQLVQHSSDIIAVVDGDGAVTYASPAVTRALGYHPDDVLGRQVTDFVDPAHHSLVSMMVLDAQRGDDNPDLVELRLRHADGRWLWFAVSGRNLLTDPAVSGIVVNARDVTEQKHYEERLLHLAVHDPLTGLPNRVLLEDRLRQALARRSADRGPVAVLFLDIDRFKLVNDSAGHVVGDRLLVEVARSLQDVVRAADTVARFGGDEFVVVSEGCPDEQAMELAQRLRRALTRPITIEDDTFFIDVSIGVAVASEADPADLLRDADSAMYAAKERGRGRIETFEPALRTLASSRLQMLGALHGAVANDELVVAYQPIVELASGRCVGAEALVRWQHPELGTVHPGDFIALAEESGLIADIGEFVLRDAATHAAQWASRQDGFYVSVNVASRQLQDPEFASTFQSVVADCGAPPRSVMIELTETVVMQEGGGTRANLERLSEAGVRVAIDDFGTGYSSLAYLKRLPVQVIKIDGSFVAALGQEPIDSAIVRAIATLGTSLGLTVIAEHVETERQRHLLEELGCSAGQGYLFSPAVSAAEIDPLLDA